jgi:hypothetical protein
MHSRKLDHSRVTHSASQMKVKMSLGKSHQIMRHAQLSPTGALPAASCRCYAWFEREKRGGWGALARVRRTGRV